MAEATLNDVVNRLRTDNAKQLESQRDTTEAISALTGTINGLLTQMELEGLRQKERDREAKGKDTAAKAKSSSKSSFSESLNLGSIFSGITGPIGIIASTIGGIAAAASGFALATEGLGPSLEQFRNFTTRLTRIFLFPVRFLTTLGRALGGRSLAQYLSTQLSRFNDFVSRRYSFDGRNFQRLMRAGGGTGFVAGRDISFYQRTLARLNLFFGQVSKMFSAIRIPTALVRDIGRLNAGLLSSLGIRSGVVGGFMNSRLVRGIFRFLRPIAAIFSIFDGIRNAADEMEEREGLFNRLIGGGLGGFVSGAFGSFFGEMANLLRDIPLWLIKQFVPAEWLNEDGTFRDTDENGNWFTAMLKGVEGIDFNGLITRIFQYPFDILGNTLDYFRNLFGAAGTTEEGREQARAAFNQWWSNFSSVSGTLENIGDVFKWMANIAFSPLNAILHEIETAFFGADPNRESQTFSERISGYLRRIGDYFMQWIAEYIGPGELATFLGLDRYLQSDEDQQRRISDAQQRLRDVQAQARDVYARYDLNRDGIIDDTERGIDDLAGQELGALRAEAIQAERDANAAIAALAAGGNVGNTNITQIRSGVENLMLETTGAIDRGDIRDR